MENQAKRAASTFINGIRVSGPAAGEAMTRSEARRWLSAALEDLQRASADMYQRSLLINVHITAPEAMDVVLADYRHAVSRMADKIEEYVEEIELHGPTAYPDLFKED